MFLCGSIVDVVVEIGHENGGAFGSYNVIGFVERQAGLHSNGHHILFVGLLSGVHRKSVSPHSKILQEHGDDLHDLQRWGNKAA